MLRHQEIAQARYNALLERANDIQSPVELIPDRHCPLANQANRNRYHTSHYVLDDAWYQTKQTPCPRPSDFNWMYNLVGVKPPCQKTPTDFAFLNHVRS